MIDTSGLRCELRSWGVSEIFGSASKSSLGLKSHTNPKTQISPKKGWLLEEHFPVEFVPFHVTFVHCRGGNLVIRLFGIF